MCTGHVNSCPTHVGYEPAVTPTVWTDPTLTQGEEVKSIHHNELRTAIIAELGRWGKTWPVDPLAVAIEDPVSYLHVRRLRDGINAATTWTWPSYLNDTETEIDDAILKDQYNGMRTRVNAIEATCACDCNYACTCNCNYACTCDCNYTCTLK